MIRPGVEAAIVWGEHFGGWVSVIVQTRRILEPDLDREEMQRLDWSDTLCGLSDALARVWTYLHLGFGVLVSYN